MCREEFTRYLKKSGYDESTIESYLNGVHNAQEYFKDSNILNVDVEGFKEYVAHLLETGENSEANLVGLARYVYFKDMKSQWIYFTTILGGREVFPSIEERLEKLTDKETAERIFSKINVPKLGEGPGKYPQATMQLMDQLRGELPPNIWKRVLSGNHHRMPLEMFAKHKKRLEELGSVEEWLKQMHHNAVEELEEHYKENKIWYEQVITKDVVDFVKGSQELLSGVRVGDWIYNTKFPYSPKEYLEAQDPDDKRYLMCHCVLAREAVKTGSPDIPMEWCYCSAGYGKLRYDVAFSEETEVEVLESVFCGSDKCRFRYKIPQKYR